MSDHRVRTWDLRGSKPLSPKLLPLGHHLDDPMRGGDYFGFSLAFIKKIIKSNLKKKQLKHIQTKLLICIPYLICIPCWACFKIILTKYILLHRSTSKPWYIYIYMSFYWNFLLLLGNKKSGGSCARCANFESWTFKNRIIWKHEIFEFTPNQWSSSQRMLQTSSQRDYMALLAWIISNWTI